MKNEIISGLVVTLGCGLLSGCGGLSGQGPSASEIRKEGAGRYDMVEVGSREAIPAIKPTFVPSGLPDVNSRGYYTENITVRDQLEMLITDSSERSPFYRSGSAYTYGPVEVPESGDLKFPYIGEINVNGTDLSALSAEISQKVKTVSASAEATVRRVARLEKRANVLGDVRESGPVEIDRRGFSILDLLAQAGGTNDPAHLYKFTLQRRGVDYFYDEATLRANPFPVEDGDLLRVEKDPNRVFFVMGAVNREGRYDFPVESPTVADALAQAAGLNLSRSNPNGVFVFRKTGGATDKAYGLDLKSSSSAYLTREFPLQGGDWVYVSEAPLSEWNRLINNILPFGNAAMRAASPLP